MIYKGINRIITFQFQRKKDKSRPSSVDRFVLHPKRQDISNNGR